MDSIINLAQSRKARQERGEQLSNAASDLLALLNRQRESISEEFMTFLVAMAVSDQAIQYAKAGDRSSGSQFIEQLFTTAQQLFETHYRPDCRVPVPVQSGYVLEMSRPSAEAQRVD